LITEQWLSRGVNTLGKVASIKCTTLEFYQDLYFFIALLTVISLNPINKEMTLIINRELRSSYLLLRLRGKASGGD
jgi:hypothetical protein